MRYAPDGSCQSDGDGAFRRSIRKFYAGGGRLSHSRTRTYQTHAGVNITAKEAPSRPSRLPRIFRISARRRRKMMIAARAAFAHFASHARARRVTGCALVMARFIERLAHVEGDGTWAPLSSPRPIATANSANRPDGGEIGALPHEPRTVSLFRCFSSNFYADAESDGLLSRPGTST